MLAWCLFGAAAAWLRASSAPSAPSAPCELPADLRNHTEQGWSLLQVPDEHLIALGQDLDDEDGTMNLLLWDCQQKKQLLFVHIPKNAGSTIEDIAVKKGVRWGRYRTPNQIRMPDGNWCSRWHVPPRYLPEPNPYANAEVFCVTRHPYDRAVSEYRYLLNVKWGNDNPRLRRQAPCTAAGLNSFIGETLQMVQHGHRFISDCHFTPQTEFIWGPHKQWCTNILKIDTLPQSFNALMRAKGYSVSLGVQKHNSMADKCGALSTASFSPHTKQLLNQVYAEDFAKLGYQPQ